jgi:RND superfamily putative drug exporter
MIGLARWCITHRRWVLVGWIAIAVGSTAIATAVGRSYSTNFSLPNTESQHAVNLLQSEFKSQSGDLDTIVVHYSRGSIDSPAVRSVITPLLARVTHMPHVVTVVSPYSSLGALQVSRDRTTAFATINYSKRANLLPNATGKPVLNAINAIHVPGLKIDAGGQVIEDAEGFSIGPATGVGVIAALIILLLTFGSLAAAGMPLITAAFGLVTGIALVGLATHITSMSNISPQLAVMIGLGVGIDYALFIVTRFRENYLRHGNVEQSIVEAMDTSGRAILLAGTTVIIALLGMFATGVSFLYGLSIASVLAVLLVLAASLTVVPSLLSRWGDRLVRPTRAARRHEAAGKAPRPSRWRQWSVAVQRRPLPLAAASLAVMILVLVPVFGLRLDTSDAGNDPTNTSSYQAFNLLAQGFGQGFNGPLTIVVQVHSAGQAQAAVPAIRAAVAGTPDVVAVTAPRVAPSGRVVVLQAYPGSAPQATATTDLVNRLRHTVLPPLKARFAVGALVGGFTAGSIDFSNVLASKLPLFIGLVVVLSALLLFVIFRSLVIPLQAALMNLLSIGGALGATVAVFQWGWGSSLLGIQKGPIEPWIPVLMFAVVFGLSMDYEVFLISRVREEWVRHRDAGAAVADGIAFTGRVITAAAAIMICVFLSFMLGDQRSIKEFGFGLAAAVFLDALVVRCVLLPAVLELLGGWTWKLPAWIDSRLPRINIEGGAAAAQHSASADGRLDGAGANAAGIDRVETGSPSG